MRIFKAFAAPWCTLLKRSDKGAAFFVAFIKSWCAFLRRSPWVAMPIRQNKFAARRIVDRDSCIPVSRPTMNYSVLSLPNAQALCTPHPPSRKLRGVSRFLHPHDEVADRSGFEHFLCTPLTKIAGRLRLFAPP